MRRDRSSSKIAIAPLLLLALTATAAAQFDAPARRFELSASIQIEDVEETDAKSQLARIGPYLREQKWDEAVETLRKIAETYPDRVLQLDERRYTSIRNYCNTQFAALPAEGLKLYRERVDPIASAWYKQGVTERDERRLEDVVEQFFASSFGDDALLALGEIALERGEYGRARASWEQISPRLRGPEGEQVWQLLYGVDLERNWNKIRPLFQADEKAARWVAYPDTDLDLAAVRARLVLVSIIEGDRERATEELELFKRLHPESRGSLAGREGHFDEILGGLLTAAEHWPARVQNDDWPTLAGSADRNWNRAQRLYISGLPTWQISLDSLAPQDADFEPRRRRWRSIDAFERDESRLRYHPVIVGNVALLCNQQQIFAFDVRTGKPAWPSAKGLPGQIFPGGGESSREETIDSRSAMGVPRYTLSADGDLLFVRIGSPVTSRAPGLSPQSDSSKLVCLNLKKGGWREWIFPQEHDRLQFEEEGWAIEGPPVSDGQNVYVAMRRSAFRPAAYLAALSAHTGRLLWRRRICSADTPGHAHSSRREVTHNLLTLSEGMIYFNTNLGAVAAVRARDGAVRWVYRYERATGGDLFRPAAHFERDLNPCVYYRGLVIAAPSDSSTIVAIDALTGRLAWSTAPTEEHPVHLLGVADGRLIATGASVWWINAASGRMDGLWPEPGLDGERGFGRGVLAGGCIYWPTREQIVVLDAKVHERNLVRIVDRIELTSADLDDRAIGGNLVVSGGAVLVAGRDRLYGFVRRRAGAGAEPATPPRKQRRE